VRQIIAGEANGGRSFSRRLDTVVAVCAINWCHCRILELVVLSLKRIYDGSFFEAVSRVTYNKEATSDRGVNRNRISKGKFSVLEPYLLYQIVQYSSRQVMRLRYCESKESVVWKALQSHKSINETAWRKYRGCRFI